MITCEYIFLKWRISCMKSTHKMLLLGALLFYPFSAKSDVFLQNATFADYEVQQRMLRKVQYFLEDMMINDQFFSNQPQIRELSVDEKDKTMILKAELVNSMPHAQVIFNTDKTSALIDVLNKQATITITMK
jgi:hypothetical protein